MNLYKFVEAQYVKNFKLKNLEAVDAIKKSVIEDFKKHIKRLERGYFDDYSLIMDKILYIESCEHLGKDRRKIYEFLMNS